MQNWTEADAVPLRTYLATPSGQKLIYNLQRLAEVEDGLTLEQEALLSREFKGAKKILDAVEWARVFQTAEQAAEQIQYYQ